MKIVIFKEIYNLLMDMKGDCKMYKEAKKEFIEYKNRIDRR